MPIDAAFMAAFQADDKLFNTAFEKKIVDDAQKVADALKKMEIKITAKTGAGDKLFGSVSNIDLADAIAKGGQEIDKKFVKINGGLIKRTGKYNAEVRLHRDVIVELPFEVIAEAK